MTIRIAKWALFAATAAVECYLLFWAMPVPSPPDSLQDFPMPPLHAMRVRCLIVSLGGLLVVARLIAHAVVRSGLKPGRPTIVAGVVVFVCLCGLAILSGVLLFGSALKDLTGADRWAGVLVALLVLGLATHIVSYLDSLLVLRGRERGGQSG